MRSPLIQELQELRAKGVTLKVTGTGSFLAHIRARSSIADHIRTSQVEDPELVKIMDKVKGGEADRFTIDDTRVRTSVVCTECWDP